jgi:hypothetical protein
MRLLNVTSAELNPVGYYTLPLQTEDQHWIPPSDWVRLFDQNGYALCEMEQRYAQANKHVVTEHRPWEQVLKYDWFTQTPVEEGAVLNHSMLFERKGVSGQALAQLKQWCDARPIFHKVRNIRPKWGLDFSMDWVDRDGNAFEILHWEWDDFNFHEIEERKYKYQRIFLGMDWQHAGQQLLKHRSQWQYLNFFEQSDWKCNYFGIEKEQFKQVVW